MVYNFSQFKSKLDAVKDWLRQEYSGIRTGKAVPAVLDNIRADAYGSKMPINQLGSVVAEDPRTLRVVPWDAMLTKSIEKSIISSDLGLSVIVDEKGLRVIFPELTGERRDSLSKVVRQKLEDARVSVRNEREEVWEDIQTKEKNGEMTEDEKFRFKEEMQKIVDAANKELEDLAERKEKDLLS